MKITQAPSPQETIMTSNTRAERRDSVEIDAQTKVVLDSFTSNSELPEGEFVRVPFGSVNSQLSATEIPGYHLHWINDWHPQYADRVQQALKAGYRFVTESETETAPILGYKTRDLSGNRVSRTVGTQPSGEPITSYLMKIPTAWWLEHQKQVWDHADRVDNAIRRGASGSKVEAAYNPRNDPTKISTKLQQGVEDGKS